MNRIDYVTSQSRMSPRSWEEEMDSEFFSSFSSGSLQDTQSTGIYFASNFTSNLNPENRKSSLSYRAKNALLKTRMTIKTKLKTTIFPKTSNNNQHVDFPDETHSVNKDTARKKQGTVQKLMEKSLGLFRIRSRKEKNEKNVLKKETIQNSCSNIYHSQSLIFARTDYCCLLQIDPLLMVPSMCSSFAISSQEETETCMHSTPCSLSRQFSPINWPRYDNYCGSTSSSSSTSSSIGSINDRISNPSTSSTVCSDRHRRRRLSFGATSSPTSISISSTKLSPNSSSQLSVNQLQCIDHINKIKKNLKLEFEMKSLREEFGRVESHRDSANMMPSKKRKLQHIFRINLKKQLKEMKKSQNGIRGEQHSIDFEFKNNKQNTCNLSAPSKRFRFDGAECSCIECVQKLNLANDERFLP